MRLLYYQFFERLGWLARIVFGPTILERLTTTLCVYPAFASSIITELYNDTGRSYVKFKYDGVELNLCNKEDHTCDIQEYEDMTNKTLNGYTAG